MERELRIQRPSRLVLPPGLIPETLRLGCGGAAREDRNLSGQLEKAGITVDGRLHPVAERLFDILDDPFLIVRACVEDRHGRSRATVWATPDAAVIAASRSDGAYELSPVRVGVLTFHLADFCGVVARDAAFAGTRLEAGESNGLRRLVHDVTVRRFSVRSVWRDALLRDSTVHVMDGGALGHWQVWNDDTIEGLTTGGVLAAIAATLPPRQT